MKKIFLTFVLAIVSSLWIMSEGASCLTQAPNNLQSSYITVSGTIQWLDNPCEEGEVCPACITPAIVTSDKTYYLSSSNQEVQDFLDRIEMAPVPAIYQLPLQASATGIPYTQGSFDFLVVNNLNSLYVQYFSDQGVDPENPIGQPTGLLGSWIAIDDNQEVKTLIIDRTFYNSLGFRGLIRSYDKEWGDLIYKQKGDRLYVQQNCVMLDMPGEEYNCISFSTTYSVENDILTLDSFMYEYNKLIREFQLIRNESVSDNAEVLITGKWYAKSDDDNSTYAICHTGRQGLISIFEILPNGDSKYLCDCKIEQKEDGRWMLSPSHSPWDDNFEEKYILCKLTMDEMVWMEEVDGEQHFTYFKHLDEADNESGLPTDTIPLYARDDSGSSTVDPVDPNQIYATLTGNVLTIHNRTGAQVTFTLNNTSVNNVAARVRANGQPTTFTESISVELTEDGLYEIWLTSEEWNYSVFGTINYVRSATTITKEDPALTTKKVLRGTQILIERGDKTYTLTGQEVK